MLWCSTTYLPRCTPLKSFGSSSNSCIYAIWMEFKVGFARNWSIIWNLLRLTSSLLFDDNLAWPEFATLRPSDWYYDNWNPTKTIPDFMGLDKIFLPRSLTGSISSWNVLKPDFDYHWLDDMHFPPKFSKCQIWFLAHTFWDFADAKILFQKLAVAKKSQFLRRTTVETWTWNLHWSF